jgi:predicted MFS family arabinose efflux permease
LTGMLVVRCGYRVVFTVNAILAGFAALIVLISLAQEKRSQESTF